MEALIEDLRAVHAHVNPQWLTFSSDISDAFGNEKEFADLETFAKLSGNTFDHWFGDAEKEKKLNQEFVGFAQKGEGSQAAIWLLEGTDIETAPVVLIGSEGEVGVIAPNYYTFMVLSGQGYDVYDMLAGSTSPSCDPCQPFLDFMEKELQQTGVQDVSALLNQAKADNPDLEAYLF